MNEMSMKYLSPTCVLIYPLCVVYIVVDPWWST